MLVRVALPAERVDLRVGDLIENLIRILFVVGVLVAIAGCGGDVTPEATTATTSPPGSAPDPAPLPPVAEPAPAQACTGSDVLCVDSEAAADEADGSATRPYASVTAALAGAEPGAVIQVAAGDYAESLLLESVSGLRLVGGFPAGGDFSSRDPAANETVLRGDDESAVVNVTASDDILIEGFRITGGGGFFDGYETAGGGVFIDQESTDVSVVANRIDGNAVDRGPEPEYSEGGGIASYGTGVEIVGNVVEGNRAGRGAGVATRGGVVDGNTVADNFAVGDHGGGIYATGELTISRNHVSGNSIGTEPGYGWGGGIIVFGTEGEATLQGNVVTGNLAVTYGSGVFIDEGARATLRGELYYANECSEEGGAGLFVDSGGPSATMADVIHVTIAEHDCPDAAQGGNAVYVGRSDAGDPMPVVTITNSILWGNAGTDLLVVDADVTVTYTLSEEGIDGEGNLSDDPLFADTGAGDFGLRPSSPAQGAGDPAAGGADLGHTGAG